MSAWLWVPALGRWSEPPTGQTSVLQTARPLGLATAQSEASRAQRSLLAQAKSAVHVHQVEMGGPGQKGGIEQYDVIAAVNGKMVESVDDIYRIIGSKAVGTGGFQVTVIRPMINEWRVVDLTVPFMERPKAALPSGRRLPP